VRRREFLVPVGAAAATRLFAAHPQQPAKAHRIAVVHASAPIALIVATGNIRLTFKTATIPIVGTMADPVAAWSDREPGS